MKNNINFIISHLSNGGAQKVITVLSFGLSSFYNIYITLHEDKNIVYKYKGSIINLGLPASNNLVKKIIIFIRRVIKLNKLKIELGAKANISFLESSNMINLLSVRSGKTIISVRNYKSMQVNNAFSTVYAYLIKLLYKKSDLIVAASEGIKKDLIEKYGLKKELIKCIYNPLDINDLNNKAKENIETKYIDIFNTPVIITSGRLSRQKGHWYLFRVLEKIKEAIPNVKLLVLGSGELEYYLKSIVQERGLSEVVVFLGRQNNPHKFVARSSLFLFPSLYEGFPNALVEAMSCGIPVISADCPSGPREILAPSTDISYQTSIVEYAEFGVLTPPLGGSMYEKNKDITKEELLMAQASIELINNCEKYCNYERRGKERANDFHLDTIVKQWIEIIEN